MTYLQVDCSYAEGEIQRRWSAPLSITLPALSPATLYSALRSSKSATVLYCLEMVIWKVKAPEMKAASRVKLCLPEPPTPTSSQGLTFVHLSAQRKRFLWDKGCVHSLCRGCLGVLGGITVC